MTEAEEILVGECIKAMARLLNSRRKLVKVQGLQENSFAQAIALGAMFYKLAEIQPPEAWKLIDEEANRISALIGRRRQTPS